MSSRRIQFTLNSQKEKERVILDLLSTFYDEAIGIKEVLYKYAISQNVQIEIIEQMEKNEQSEKSERKEQITQSVQIEQKAQKEKIEQSRKSEDDGISVDLSKFNNEVPEVKEESENKSREIKQKKLKALKQFI